LAFQIISLDVTAFRPLKLFWKTAVLDWHRQTSGKILNKELFAPLLDKKSEEIFSGMLTIQGFRAGGFYSWSSENADFSNSLRNN
jgi:hypothetical protein